MEKAGGRGGEEGKRKGDGKPHTRSKCYSCILRAAYSVIPPSITPMRQKSKWSAAAAYVLWHLHCFLLCVPCMDDKPLCKSAGSADEVLLESTITVVVVWGTPNSFSTESWALKSPKSIKAILPGAIFGSYLNMPNTGTQFTWKLLWKFLGNFILCQNMEGSYWLVYSETWTWV